MIVGTGNALLVARRVAVFVLMVAVVAALLATLAPSQAVGALPTTGVWGRVTDFDTGAPLTNAQVQVYSTSGGAPVTTVNSNANGYFYVSMLAPGEYRLTTLLTDYRLHQSPKFTYAGSLVVRDIEMRAITSRFAGPDRYDTAVEIGRNFFDWRSEKDWPMVEHIIIASGEDRAAADPLAAASLMKAHPGPLFLVSSAKVPSSVKQAVAEIAAANAPIDVWVVGGPVSVPDARLDELNAAAGGGLTFHRMTEAGDRYDLAYAIALHLDVERGSPANVILLANGEDPTKFFDALSLSPVAGQNGFPVLLVGENRVPWQTESYIRHATPLEVYIGGGPATVDVQNVENVVRSYPEVNALDRWWGGDRYKTSTAIASGAIDAAFLTNERFGVASKLPDALTGGATVGFMSRGPLVLTETDRLTPSTGTWITANGAHLRAVDVYGGVKSITPSTMEDIAAAVP
jgi:putative cell wall-binding protein